MQCWSAVEAEAVLGVDRVEERTRRLTEIADAIRQVMVELEELEWL